MTGLIPEHRQQQIIGQGSAFFHWWFDELRQMLPQGLRDSFVSKQGFYRLIAQGGRVEVVWEKKNEQVDLGGLDLCDSNLSAKSTEPSDPSTEADDLTHAMGGEGEKNVVILQYDIANTLNEGEAAPRVSLELANEYLLIRELNFPLVSDDDIGRVLEHEIERFSPFLKQNVCFSYQVVERNPELGKLKLRLVCVEREVLERLLDHCATLGLAVTDVVPAELDASSIKDESSGIRERNWDLLPADRKPAKRKMWDRSNLQLLGVAALLFAVLIILPPTYFQGEIDRLEIQVAALKNEAKKVSLKQSVLSKSLDIRSALALRKEREHEKLRVLHTLTTVMPDHTWLTRLDVQQNIVAISGESEKSSELIEKLESQAIFNQVEFSSSVTRNRRTGKERFQIKMQLSDKAESQLSTSATKSVEKNLTKVTAQNVQKKGVADG